MDDPLIVLREDIQAQLDEVLSPRAPLEAKARALQRLESLLGNACISKDKAELEDIVALQYTFECNIPSRLLPWMSTASSRLEYLSTKSTVNEEGKHEAADLSSLLFSSLSIIQGVILNHPPSKEYFGRTRTLEVLVDLLLVSRHVPSVSSSTQPTSTSPSKSSGTTLSLSSAVLDTLLCVLVDSSAALRAFEECNGLQAIVKILKRAGTPREIRMKCLEFLYFYLLDETCLSTQTTLLDPTPPSTVPNTPLRASSHPKAKKPFINSTPNRPMSRYGSSTFSFSGGSFPSIPSSQATSTASDGSSTRSTSSSSVKSSTSTSSVASTSTAPSSASSSPKKRSLTPLPSVSASPAVLARTPPSSPPLSHAVMEPKTPKNKPRLPPNLPSTQRKQVQPKSLLMLRKDVEYEPQSPQKVLYGSQVAGSGGVRRHARTRSRLGSVSSTSEFEEEVPKAAVDEGVERVETEQVERMKSRARTTEEKKELLGTMLGNVDALVEGVRKAGIWGLG